MAVSGVIHIFSLRKTYSTSKGAQIQAVKDINLAIPSDCIFGLLGEQRSRPQPYTRSGYGRLP